MQEGVRRGDNKGNIQLSSILVRPRFRDFLRSFVVADDRRASFREQSRKEAVAAADVQDALVVQIAQHRFDGRKMQRSAKRVSFDVVGELPEASQ